MSMADANSGGGALAEEARQKAAAAQATMEERTALLKAEQEADEKLQRVAKQYRKQLAAAEKAERKGKTADAVVLYEEVAAGYEHAGFRPPGALLEKVGAAQLRLAAELEAKARRERVLQRAVARLRKQHVSHALVRPAPRCGRRFRVQGLSRWGSARQWAWRRARGGQLLCRIHYADTRSALNGRLSSAEPVAELRAGAARGPGGGGSCRRCARGGAGGHPRSQRRAAAGEKYPSRPPRDRCGL